MAVYTASSYAGLSYRNAGISGVPVPRALGALTRPDGYGGPGTIADSIAVEDPIGTPERAISRRVTLLDRRGLTPIRSVMAGADGSYAFTHLRTDIPFMVVADDYQGVYNAVIADWIYAR